MRAGGGWGSGAGDPKGDSGSAGRHGLPGIRHQVDHDLLHLPSVNTGEDRDAVRCERQHGVVLRGQRLEHV